MTFITGNRYILIGTKEGRIQIVDSSIGELVVDQEAHEGPVWSVALQPPDGKAFMSGGADKVVKFWDFTVTCHAKPFLSHPPGDQWKPWN